MKRPSVDPAFTFGIALVLSLVLWWGTLCALLDGRVDIITAGLRYLASLALAWSGTFFIGSLVAMYASQPRPAPPRTPIAAAPQRRREDMPPLPPSMDPDEAESPAA